MTHRIRSFIRVAAATLLLTLVSAMPVAATSPSVIVGAVDGSAIITNGSSFNTITALSVPAGSWLVTATATITAANYGAFGYVTACRLAGGTDTDSSRWNLTGATGQARSMDQLLLTFVHTSASSWFANLACKTQASTGDVTLSRIRISAVKGITSGAGSPAIRGAGRSSSVSTVGDNSFHPIMSLSLPAGRWWIVAKTNIANTYTSDVNVPTCQLALGTDIDQTREGLYYPPQAGAYASLGVQVAHVFSSSGSATLQCKAVYGFSTDNVRITAIGAGALTRKVFGGSSSTSGSGTPVIIAGSAKGPLNLAGGNTFTTVATLSIPAGKWLISGKIALEDRNAKLVQCRIVAGADQAQSDTRGGPHGFGGVFPQTAHTFTSAGSASLQCKVPDGVTGDAKANYIHITAISASTLTRVMLAL